MSVRGRSGEVKNVYTTRTFCWSLRLLPSMTAFDTTKISPDAGVEVSAFLDAPVLNRHAADPHERTMESCAECQAG
jgi:hypothetical protein